MLHLLRFSQPETLERIERGLLVRFLSPWAGFFAGRGIPLPTEEESQRLDLDAIVAVLLDPGRDTPADLPRALYLVDDLATPEGMDRLAAACATAGLAHWDGPDLTPAEMAIRVWLEDPDLLERTRSELIVHNIRTFEYFQSLRRGPLQPSADPAALAALEVDLAAWFEERRRGRSCRIFSFENGPDRWYVVQHGDLFRREASLEEGEPSRVAYRPQKNDPVVYDPERVELRINARSQGEKDLYRRKFGLHLFGHEDFFPGGNKYTLQPLREAGRRSLVCTDIEGLASIRLVELEMAWGGPYSEVVIWKADDVFAALDARGEEIPERPRLRRARFEVHLTGVKRPRKVTLRPSNLVQYTRDHDSHLIEQWLARRGFVHSRAISDVAA
jgi:hypothetical protein